MNIGETLPLSSRIVANKRSAACDLEGEMVILNLDSGVYFGLNSVGGAIWNFIQSERSPEEIIAHLLAEYKVERARCEAEVISLLRSMLAQGLIDIQANAQAA
jgi:coenzyme PQQ synthesis protein D (PqqD)